MKLTAILLLAGCLHVSATGNGQKVTIDVKNTSIKKVFKEVIRQSGFSIIYDAKLFENVPPVTIRLSNATVEEVVKKCLEGLPYSYVIEGNTILVTAKPTDKEPGIVTIPPPIDVKGRVVNEKGEPVIATVTVKGTKKATSTNENGEFVLTGVEDDATLVITGVGIETFEVRVNGRADLATVTGKIKIIEQEEVIINAGYYTTTKRSATGNISRVDAKTIEKQSVANPLQALQGRMAGVNIIQETGLPGGGFKVQIRGGQNSLRTSTGANNPLYIVDGVPYISGSISGQLLGILNNNVNPLSIINPLDIESIEILKDADATAIYGSRGSNGVVLITTKKDKSGKTTIDINHYSGFGEVSNEIDLLNSTQYREMRFEGLENNGFNPLPPGWQIFFPDLFAWDSAQSTNWQNELIGGRSYITNTRASISGGNANTQFLLSSNYYNEGSVFPGNFNYNRYSGLLNLNHTTTEKKFNVDFSISYSGDKNTLPQSDLTMDAISLPPNAPKLFKDNGDINWENNTFLNPLAALQFKKYEARTTALITSASLSYQISGGLKISTSLGYTITQLDEVETEPLAFRRPDIRSNFQSGSRFADNRLKTWIVEPKIEYQKSVSKGNLTFLLGTTFQETIREGETIIASGFPSDAVIENPQAANMLSILPVYSQYRYNAVFGRVNYNWKSKYIVNLTGRRDGSSRFGPGKQFANFGAIGTSWIFSNEGFLKNGAHILSHGKLRGSYGTTGNDQIGDYSYLNSYSLTRFPYQNNVGLIPTRVPNDNYSWETNNKLEIALELGLINDRIELSTSWYKNHSSNQLVGLPMPVITGSNMIQFNIPALIENKGWEFEVKSTNIKSSNFEWVTTANLTIPRSQLLKFSNIENSPYSKTYKVGESLFIKNLLNEAGVDPTTGLYIFKDLNNDGIISFNDDRIFSDEITQDYFGGLQNTISYSNIQLDFLFQFVKQTGYNYLNSFSTAPGGESNQPTVVLNRWRKPGDITSIQQYSAFGSVSDLYTDLVLSSNGPIDDASFVRLKNVSLSYVLPGNALRKFKLTDCKIYIQGQNLITITDYLGLDPESQTSTRLPPLRTITAGIQFRF